MVESFDNNGFKNLGSLTKWIKYMLYAQMLFAIISIIFGYLEYQLLSGYRDGVHVSQETIIADMEANDIRQGIVSVIYMIIYFVLAFLVLKWIYRANYNARKLGAENMKFTPGWSIGYYFIPILAIWKPYQAMKEIWQASKNPLDWTSQNPSGILSIWWILWLTSNILGQIIFKLSMRAEELQELIDLNLITQISDSLDIPLALVLLLIVNSIYKMQMSHIENDDNKIEKLFIK
jgi:hypothetical protein